MEIRWILSWVGVILTTVCIGGYLFLKWKGHVPNWLSGFIHGDVFLHSSDKSTTVEQLKEQTDKEIVKAAELREMLEAKRVLMRAKATSIKLQKEIDGTDVRSVGKEQREQEADAEKKVEKPKRL